MRNIADFPDEKYAADGGYECVETGIYRSPDDPDTYVTSLSFEQEPERGEGDSPARISQYPLEDVLDRFDAWVEDFYPELNNASERTCYQEFGSTEVEDLRRLRDIIGRHVYLRHDDGAVTLVIE